MKGAVAHDDALNELGREQAKRAAEICAEFNPTIVYSSPFKRTQETAEIIASKCNSKLVLSDKLKEVTVGDWADLSLEEGRQKFIDAGMWNYNEDKFEFTPPGGESWMNVCERTDEIIDNAIFESGADDTVVFVTHNAAMKAMVGSRQGKHFKDWLPIMFTTGSVTAFEYKDGEFIELFVDRH